MKKIEKLYICLDEDSKISIQTREDVDEWIKNAEEARGHLYYTIVGNILRGDVNPHFLVRFTVGSLSGYEVVAAKSIEEAKESFTIKRATKGKKIQIQNIQTLTPIIKDYYGKD